MFLKLLFEGARDIPALDNLINKLDCPFSAAELLSQHKNRRYSCLVLDAENLDSNAKEVRDSSDSFLAMCAFCQTGSLAELLFIGVLPDFRRQGLASLLLQRLVDEANKTDVERIELEVRESNIFARRLYERFHFQLEGERKNYYPRLKKSVAEASLEKGAGGARESALLYGRNFN